MGDYFSSNQSSVDLLPSELTGLRVPQLGAAAAILSHGTRSVDDAVVVLPTGTGKTAVLQLTPYLWKAERVLVVTPSRLVREQIVAGFENLALLKGLGVLPEDMDCPKVRLNANRIRADQEWEEFRQYDVVVTTPMSASPSLKDVPSPRNDLFDIVIVDEAHHTPATSYQELLNAFPHARKALFTATPFRRDKQRVPGKIVYNYPLRDSINDGTYGQLEFVPCEPTPGQDHDVAIALAAEQAFLEDSKAGLDHRLMVRTDSVERAKHLTNLYRDKTQLKLRLVHGGHSLKHVNSVVKKLNEGELDGVICVDMFAEGVDFPRLKIAALHAPHKSLAVTLQFIGRFARTNSEYVGTAKFIAVPQEIDSEVRELYRNNACWEDLVANLSDARIEEEEQIRTGLSTFQTEHREELGDLDVTIDSIRPYFHTKVFRVDEPPNLRADPVLFQKCELVFNSVSDQLSTAIVIARRSTKPKWIDVPSVTDIKNLLYLVHYNEEHGLLFINSAEKTEEVYEQIAESLYESESSVVCIPLAHDVVSRALRILRKPNFFNVGMRNRVLGNQSESYRTLTGPAADRNVSRSDASSRSRGHVFGGSRDADEKSTTIGISTLSKVWSNRTGLIPEFVSWCARLAEELNNATPVATGSNIDMLGVGKRCDKIPSPPIGVAWNEHFYKFPKQVFAEGTNEEYDLTGMEIVPDTSTCTETKVSLDLLINNSVTTRYRFDLSTKPYFARISGPKICCESQMGDGSLEDLLNLRPPTMFLADFSTLVGNELYQRKEIAPLDESLLMTFEEFENDVDIECEVSNPKAGRVTIHAFTEQQFLAGTSDIVIYDHRTGEVADFVAIEENAERIVCTLAHCKGAGGAKPGCRVGDAYEVAGQIVKCLPYRSPSELLSKLTKRLASGSVLKRGNVDKLERILRNAEKKHFEFRLCLVQPGISAAQLNDKVGSVLAAAGDYVLSHTGFNPFYWISA